MVLCSLEIIYYVWNPNIWCFSWEQLIPKVFWYSANKIYMINQGRFLDPDLDQFCFWGHRFSEESIAKLFVPSPPSSIPAYTHKHTGIHTHSCSPFNNQVSLNCSRTQQLWVCKPFWEKLTSPTTPSFSVYITRKSSKRFNAYNDPYEYINWATAGGAVWGSLLFFHQYIWHHLWRANKRHTVKRTDLDKMLLFVLHKHRGIFKQRKTFHSSLGTSFLRLNYTSMFTPLCSDLAGV